MTSPIASQATLQRLIALWKLVPGGALLFAVVPLILLTYFGWLYYGAEHVDQTFYAVRKENVLLTPQPEWIRSSVLDQVFTTARLDRLTLLDPSTCATIAQAFEANPWVKQTARVTKSVGGKVAVDVVYRQPLAMVYYNPSEGTPGFYPVDYEGILLPVEGNFTEEDVRKYFVVYAGAAPRGEWGMAYGDDRVMEALKLCIFLGSQREALQIKGIYVEQDPRANGRSTLVFRLLMADQHVVLWGHAPDAEGVGEPTADQKLATLTHWLAEKRSNPSTPAQLDLLANGFGASLQR